MQIKSGIVFLIVGLAFLAQAHAAELKIGVVDAQRVIEQAPQAEQARKDFEAEFKPREDRLKEKQKQLKDMQTRYDRDGMVMSENERRKLEREIMGVKQDLQLDNQQLQEDVNIRRSEIFSKLQRHISDIIVAISKEGKYDLVLYEGVAFASDKVDITEKVLERLRKADSAKK